MEGKQGVVHWQPPEEALAKIKGLVDEPTTSHYGADDGLPELREALLEKVFSSTSELETCLRFGIYQLISNFFLDDEQG